MCVNLWGESPLYKNEDLQECSIPTVILIEQVRGEGKCRAQSGMTGPADSLVSPVCEIPPVTRTGARTPSQLLGRSPPGSHHPVAAGANRKSCRSLLRDSGHTRTTTPPRNVSRTPSPAIAADATWIHTRHAANSAPPGFLSQGIEIRLPELALHCAPPRHPDNSRHTLTPLIAKSKP